MARDAIFSIQRRRELPRGRHPDVHRPCAARRNESGLGVPPGAPSLGDLVRQGKNNLNAWWIIVPTFAALTITLLLLLTFIGEALRDAFDTRKS